MYEVNNVRVWASDLDPNALLQAEKTARLPILKGPVALMPDAHVGIGATVGSVIVTENALIPAAVGVDIGCGMIAVRTSLIAEDLQRVGNLHLLLEQFGRDIPAGVHQSRRLDSTGETDKQVLSRTEAWLDSHPVLHGLSDKYRASAWANLGTLGSGNHFLEISLDEGNVVWVVLHSGSRNIGNHMAQDHIATAKEVCKAKGIVLEDPDLAYLTSDQPEFHDYVADMLWAQDYATENREVMMDVALAALFQHVSKVTTAGAEIERINCHHNFAQKELQTESPSLSDWAWVTRKGAISAWDGQPGIVPGSMATATYLVRGRGNPLSYRSSAHGAGRRLSRGVAKRTLTVESLKEHMGDRTWLSKNPAALLDEHPDAYKDIDQVMKDQTDLVQPERRLRQVVNYKGV